VRRYGLNAAERTEDFDVEHALHLIVRHVGEFEGNPTADFSRTVLLGSNRAEQPQNAEVICHDRTGMWVLASSADQRPLREELEPRMVGLIARSYSMLAEGEKERRAGCSPWRGKPTPWPRQVSPGPAAPRAGWDSLRNLGVRERSGRGLGASAGRATRPI
jgi:hypothetical protein